MTVVSEPIDRTDGALKVTGEARYAAEFKPEGLLYAALVLSTVPKGTIERIDIGPASKAPGVRAVLTHLNAMRLPHGDKPRALVVPPQEMIRELKEK